MPARSHPTVIRLRGVRQNNLKGFDLDLPLGRWIAITGLSGSGKSSLAFDTLYAEGQRRYIETFSPYARQFFDRMDKPQVDQIRGIPPAIAIEQKNSVKSTRSTVGTMTEITDYMKALWPHVAQLYCRNCQQPVRPASGHSIWEELIRTAAGEEALILFDVPLSEKISVTESIEWIQRQGYQRLCVAGRVVRAPEALEELAGARLASLTVIQDRLKIQAANRARFVEGCEQAFQFGKGLLTIRLPNGDRSRRFSNARICPRCQIAYAQPPAALFSFNHPLGACPECRGFGRTISIDYQLAIPDWRRTLAGGAIKPWQSGRSAECQQDLLDACRQQGIPVDVPFEELPPESQRWVIEGDPDYGRDEKHEWPRAWYGVKGFFRWLESKSYKMHVRVLLSRYRAYVPCPACRGARFQPDSLLYRIPRAADSERIDGAISLAEFYGWSVSRARQFIEELKQAPRAASAYDPVHMAFAEVLSRLGYLETVGLGYLTLDRPTRTLSGGETERVNLTTCLGSRLVNALFVLDEPTVGLHPRDVDRLITILRRLRDQGNTLAIVDHEPSVIEAADHVVDLGPGHGQSGGRVVFEGPPEKLRTDSKSLTGLYLSGRKRLALPQRRHCGPPGNGSEPTNPPWLRIRGARRHNLKNLNVDLPLRRLVCITGVSGSGKSTLLGEVVWPALNRRRPLPDDADLVGEALRQGPAAAEISWGRVEGAERVQQTLMVDQSPLGRTPRSNPAVYVGAFDHVRELFARSEAARRESLSASAFSFNSPQGQCQRCRGAGFEKIEMQFLSDVFVRCPACRGRRYREHILRIRISAGDSPAWSIADFLEASVEEALSFLIEFSGSKSAEEAGRRLQWLEEVGLGYLRAGQPVNTLSGGESQRLKLAFHLGEFAAQNSAGQTALFLFDEPTTGLHVDDIRVLLQALQKLVDRGHSVVVIEHNLEVIKSADWVIDLGPDAGEAGGEIVAQGPPESIAGDDRSHTGRALRAVL